MSRIAASLTLALVSTVVIAKDHASQYEVGIFLSTERLSDGAYSYASCDSLGCSGSAYDAGHNVHYVRTPEGLYVISAPVSVAGTFLLGLSTPGGNSPTVHKLWFMDDLHDGDQVLFTAKCNQHNICQFWLPNPDKQGKEFVTNGSFHPVVSKTNTRTLCGTGKLSVVVEQQVCGQSTARATAPLPAVTMTSGASNPTPVSQTSRMPPVPQRAASSNFVGKVVPEQQAISDRSLLEITHPQPTAAHKGSLGFSGADWIQGGFTGVEILDVSPGSSAELAGLRKGYVITVINGAEVHSIRELGGVLAALEPGAKSILAIFTEAISAGCRKRRLRS